MLLMSGQHSKATTQEGIMAKFEAINRGTGSVKIHRAGCKDVKRDARGASVWTIEADSRKEIVWDVYDPSDFDYDAETQWSEFDDIEMVACTKGMLGEAKTTAKPAEAKRTRRAQINHKECDHAATPQARKVCRKAFWAAQS